MLFFLLEVKRYCSNYFLYKLEYLEKYIYFKCVNWEHFLMRPDSTIFWMDQAIASINHVVNTKEYQLKIHIALNNSSALKSTLLYNIDVKK